MTDRGGPVGYLPEEEQAFCLQTQLCLLSVLPTLRQPSAGSSLALPPVV